jgi:MFS family permease
VIAVSSNALAMNHDEGVYIATGKALAEGHGYSIDSYPVALTQTKYPVVVPFLISLVWRINPHFPQNAWLLKVFCVLTTIAWMIGCFFYFRRTGNIGISATLLLIAFVATNQWCLYLTATVMSDILYAAVAMAVLLLVVRESITDKRMVAASFLAAAAYLTRTAGVALITGVLLALIWRKRFRHAVIMAAWMFWQRQPTDHETFIEAYYTAQNYTDWSLLGGGFSLREKFTIAITNIFGVWTYPVRFIFSLPFPDNTPVIVPFLTSWLFWLPVIRGMLRAPSAFLPVSLFIGASVGVCVVWAWFPDRFLLPLVPLLLLFGYWGLPRAIPKTLLLLLLPVPVYVLFFAAQSTADRGIGAFASPPLSHQFNLPSDWRLVSSVHSWISNNTPRDAVVLATFDPGVYMYTGRKSIRPHTGQMFFYGIQRPLAEKIHVAERVMEKYRAGYLIETGHDGIEEPDFERMIAAWEQNGRIQQVAYFAPHYRIWRVVR